MNEYFQSPKSYSPYEVVKIAIFETLYVLITDNDKVIKLRSIGINNHLSRRHMGYAFSDEVWRHIVEMHEEKSDSGRKSQPIDRKPVLASCSTYTTNPHYPA